MTAALETQRLRLIRISQSANLPSREVLRLTGEDLDTLPGCTDVECLGYVRALLARVDRRAGRVPPSWTQACRCDGCGPVYLWPESPSRVIACPWCWNRVAALPVPNPMVHS